MAGKQAGEPGSAAPPESEPDGTCPGCSAGGATGTLLGAGPWLVRTRGAAGAAGAGDTTATGNATGSGSCGTCGR